MTNSYDGWTTPVKRAEPNADEKKQALFLEYVDLLQNMVKTTIENKAQWYAGENVYLTKTMFLSNDSGSIRLHHIERKGGTTVGFLYILGENPSWKLASGWEIHLLQFAEWITVSNAGEEWRKK